MTNRFPRWLAVTNVVCALLGVIGTWGIFSELTSRPIHDNTDSVSIPLADYPPLAFAVLGIGAAIVALLIASAIGGWRQRAWARRATLGWIALVLVTQVFVLVQPDGHGILYYIVSRAFPAVSVYAAVTLAALFAPSLTAATPASPRA